MMEMTDVELLCWRNSEQRKFAEEVDLRERMDELDARAELRQAKELKMMRRWRTGARIGAGLHLAVSAVFALTGAANWAAIGFIAAVFFYASAAWMGRICNG
jgi:hypothetical protein